MTRFERQEVINRSVYNVLWTLVQQANNYSDNVKKDMEDLHKEIMTKPDKE